MDPVCFWQVFSGRSDGSVLREAADRTGEDDVLTRIDAPMEWRLFPPVLKRVSGCSGSGPQGQDPLVLFSCLLIGQWHGLSDPKLERALRVRPGFMLFCGLGLHAPVPDGTTRCRFRNALVKGGVHDGLPAGVCRRTEDHGLRPPEAEAAIVDATPVQGAARPGTHIDAPQDRAEDEAADDPAIYSSADPDARWVRKGSKCTPGYKAFARTDEEGPVGRVHTTPANRAESPGSGTMIEGARAQRVLADRAYAGTAHRSAPRGRHRDGIMGKAVRNRPLRASGKRFSKPISKRRFRVGQCFGTMKRLSGLHRARYSGLARTHARLAMAATGQNLPKAANRITLNPQTPAIAQTKPPEPPCLPKGQRTRQNGQIQTSTGNQTVMQWSSSWKKQLPDCHSAR